MRTGNIPWVRRPLKNQQLMPNVVPSTRKLLGQICHGQPTFR
jgi:hypothetical protein